MDEQEYFIEEDTLPDEAKVFERAELIRALKSNNVTLSHSSFNEFCKSPRHFINYKLKDRKATPAMVFGSVVHCAILEPEKFEERYFVFPQSDLNKNTNAYKALKAEWILEAGNKEIVSAEDYAAAMRIGKSIRMNGVASDILERCTGFEVPIEWEYKGLKWRGVMDGDGRKNKVLMDLKILKDASPRAVSNYVKFEGAGRQAVHYLRGGKVDDCDYYILAVERSGNCTVSKLGKGLINQLSRDIDFYISQFKRCVFVGDWNCSFDFYGDKNGHFNIDSL